MAPPNTCSNPRVFPAISATVLTKNSERHINSVLTALAWCEEVVVLDTGSTDNTLQIAAGFCNVSIFHHHGPFPGFGPAHRRASILARHNWVLSIDSDEVVSTELAREIVAIDPDPRTVYSLPFHNYFNGRLITTCGWCPERHERLFNRTVTDFSNRPVHEKVETKGLRVESLAHPVRHYSYESQEDFLRKMQTYSSLFADMNCGRKTASPLGAWSHGSWAFFKSYILQRGFRQGYEGFVISTYNAHTAVWKYLKLFEANRRQPA